MSISTFFILYPAVFFAGAILTQLAGNAHRPFHEGVLAWLFLPVGILACLSSIATEGIKGFKLYLHEFIETLLNFHYGTATPELKDAHRINGDLA